MRVVLSRRWRASGVRRRRGCIGKDWMAFRMLVGAIDIELVARAGWGYSAWAYTSPRKGRVLLWGVETWQEMRTMRRKNQKPTESAQSHLAPMESVLLTKHHSIVAHCAVTKYDDGTPRVPGWITIRTFGTVWQVEAKDPDSLQLIRVQQPSLDDALTMMALLLDSDDAPWETDNWAVQQASRKKKK